MMSLRSIGRVRVALALAMALAMAAGDRGYAAPRKSAEERPHRVIIGLDLSTSNPLVTNDQYAAKVAARLVPVIGALVPRSEVTLRTFGVYDPTRQQLRLDRTISSVHPAEEVAAIIEGVIKGIPTLVKKGTLQAQPQTNIVAFLENTAELVSCNKVYTQVVLVSDGIEDSELARLTTVGAKLPPPAQKLFKNCRSLEILGIGVGSKSPALTNHLRDEWGAWAKAAGFKDFSGLNDW